MPAQSKAQQQLMGMAYALKKGEMDPKDASQEVKDLADSMTLKQLKKYAATKHEGLPDKVEEAKSNMKKVSKEEWNKAHKDYKTIIKGQKYMMQYDKEYGSVLVPVIVEEITPANIGGMGAVEFPTGEATGSGDVPADQGDAEEEYKKKRMKRLKTFEQFVNESHFKVGDNVTCIKSGMTGEVIELEKEHGDKDDKYYVVKREDGKIMNYSPSELKLI